MSAERREERPVQAPFGDLERALIDEYLRTRGYDPLELHTLPMEEREQILKAAAIYASGKLVEVEARSRVLDEIHDRTPGARKTRRD